MDFVLEIKTVTSTPTSVGTCTAKNLDRDLPGIAWDLLPSLKEYRTAGWHSWSNDSEKQPFAALYTSLAALINALFV